jgi:hypothetical protein
LAFYVAVNGLTLAINLTNVNYVWFVWVTPALLIAYLLLRRAWHAACSAAPPPMSSPA